MSSFLYENYRGSLTLTLLVVLDALNVLNIPMDASLACWALLEIYSEAIIDQTIRFYEDNLKKKKM